MPHACRSADMGHALFAVVASVGRTDSVYTVCAAFIGESGVFASRPIAAFRKVDVIRAAL